MPATHHRWWILFAALCLSVSAASAQKTDRGNDRLNAPTSPMAPDESSSRVMRVHEDLLPAQPPAPVPDSRPLSGAQDLTVGAIPTTHNYLLPSLSLTTQLDKNPGGFGAPNSNTVRSVSYLLGRIDLVRSSGRSEVVLDYLSGGTVSSDRSEGSSVIQALNIADTIRWRRWTVLLGDQFNYLPDSPLGFGGVGGLNAFGNGFGGLLGGNMPTLRPDLLSDQTIPTGRVTRLSNTVVAQANYQLNSRSSLTTFGSFGLLRFLEPGFLDSNQAFVQLGYDYLISRKDSIAVLYRFGAFRFPHQAQTIDTHIVQLSYARRIAGRLSGRVSAGPQIVVVAPALGSGRQLTWSLSSAMNYQLRRVSLGLSYDHFLSGGSGILAGAETDQIQGSISRDLSRAWQGTISVGYANNRAVGHATGPVFGGGVNYWYSTVRLNRSMGRGRDFFVSYSARLQGANTAGCISASCPATSVGHQVSIGFNWEMRPILLD